MIGIRGMHLCGKERSSGRFYGSLGGLWEIGHFTIARRNLMSALC